MKATLDNISITLTFAPAALREMMANGTLASLIDYAEKQEGGKIMDVQPPFALVDEETLRQIEAKAASLATPTPQETPALVPTAPVGYTYEQLAKAAAQLMDAGRQNELIALIRQFGVNSLNALPKEQYGAYAMALVQMGAKL